MADRILITTDDLEHAVRVNAQLEAAGFETSMVSSFDDVREAVRRRVPAPDCIVLTGGLHEDAASQLLSAARDRSISTLGLVEATEPDAKGLARRLGLTAWLGKPPGPAGMGAPLRRPIEGHRLPDGPGLIRGSLPLP